MRFDYRKIKYLRDKNNLSIRGLAERIGVHANVIHQWEQGRTSPSMASLERLVNTFNVSPEYFFDRERACEPANEEAA